MKQFKLTTFLILSTLLLAAGSVFAAGTAVNETITNVASATYNDSSGDPQTAISNPVTTIVQQIYNFTITPNGTEAAPGQIESALPGAPVYFNYTVTNTGNGNDTINLATLLDPVANPTADFLPTGVTIYRDTGCDGSVSGDSVISSVDLAADSSACIIVAATIPTGTANGQVGNVNLTGISATDATATDTDNWARAVANTGGNLTANKAATPSGTVAAGDTISYTVNGSNNGGSAAYGVDVSAYTGTPGSIGIVLVDPLDPNVSLSGLATGTAGAGSASIYYSADSGATWQATPTGAVNTVAMVILDPAPSSAFFTQTANYSMSFSVTVNPGVAAGTTITNQAAITYKATSTAPATTTNTNTATNSVTASYDVAIGPAGQPTTDGLSGAASYTDPVSGNTWNVTLSGGFTAGDDTQTISDAVFTGDTIAFNHTIQNTGNANDSFSVSHSTPSGYTVTLYQADGVTPLVGAVGPLAPGATQNVVVKVNVPAGATTATTVTVTVASTNNPSQTDITTDAIPAPSAGYGVNITTQADTTPTVDDAQDTLGSSAANPGTTLSFPIRVTNTGSQSDSYDLTGSLPAGWSVTFVQDANCDGTADGATVTVTTTVPAGGNVCYIAQVTIPAGASPSAANPIAFTSTSNGDASVSNTVAGTVDIGTVGSIEFVNNQIATTSPDSVVTYQHTVINNGNDTATISIPAQAAGTAFTYQYAVDTDNDGDFSDETFYTELTAANGQSFTVAASGTQTVFVQVIVPDTAADGDVEVVTVTANAAYPGGATASDTIQDRTTVQAGELDLVKTGRTCDTATCSTVLNPTGSTAEPGNFLVYTVTASNIGSGNLTNVKVSDPLPAFTNFVSVSASSTVTGTILYSTDGSTWSATAPTALAAGGTIYVGVDTNADTTITITDIVGSSQNIVLSFTVQVQ